jgi:hypothetical protein
MLLNFIDYGTINKLKINNDELNLPKEEYKNECLKILLSK